MPTGSEDPGAETPVEIWTDGGCKPNPGPGGWAAILRFRGTERELTGSEPVTTNNRMELTAAAAALESLTRPCVVVLHTDSEYVRNGIMKWHTGWVRRNWRNAAGDPVANMESMAPPAGRGQAACGGVAMGAGPCRGCHERTGGRAGDAGAGRGLGDSCCRIWHNVAPNKRINPKQTSI